MAKLMNLPVGAEAAPPLRLTRRGRLLFVSAVVVMTFGALSVGEVATQAATHVERAPKLAHVVVSPGETLWQVAEVANPGIDPRVEVQALIALNHLGDGQIFPGELLVLPPT